MDGPCRVCKCPIFCILKAVFVALLAIFVLYFPIGDPQELCNTTNKSLKQSVPMAFVCEFYFKTIKLFNKTKEVTELVVCRGLDLLYEAKLKLLPVSRFNSVGTRSFAPTKEDDEKGKPAKNILKPPPFTFPKKPEEFKYEATSSRTSENKAISLEISDTKKSATSPPESEQLPHSCSKCIEKGKTCMGSCPRQKKN